MLLMALMEVCHKKNIVNNFFPEFENPILRTIYGQQNWPLPTPVRKIMALGRKVFYYSVKCLFP